MVNTSIKYALDFGTSNTLLGAATSLGNIKSIPLDLKSANTHILKSLMYSPSLHEWHFGNNCFDQYLRNEGQGRFFRSFKTLLARKSFVGTEINGEFVSVEKLLARFLREVRQRGNSFYQQDVDKIIVGRPCLFSSDPMSNKLAENRLEAAIKLAGFKDIQFCYEPVAAAKNYKGQFQGEQVALVIDIGAGTSDFTAIKLKNGELLDDGVLSTTGINIAGDDFDHKIMKDFFMDDFGANLQYSKSGCSKVHSLPRELMARLPSPALFSLIEDGDVDEYLLDARKWVKSDEDKKRLEKLSTLFDFKLGFDLHREVEKLKVNLCSQHSNQIIYNKHKLEITKTIEFDKHEESSNSVSLEIIRTLADCLKLASLKRDNIDRVIITGGGSHHPTIIKSLNVMFSNSTFVFADKFDSVVSGLSVIAKETL